MKQIGFILLLSASVSSSAQVGYFGSNTSLDISVQSVPTFRRVHSLNGSSDQLISKPRGMVFNYGLGITHNINAHLSMSFAFEYANQMTATQDVGVYIIDTIPNTFTGDYTTITNNYRILDDIRYSTYGIKVAMMVYPGTPPLGFFFGLIASRNVTVFRPEFIQLGNTAGFIEDDFVEKSTVSSLQDYLFDTNASGFDGVGSFGSLGFTIGRNILLSDRITINLALNVPVYNIYVSPRSTYLGIGQYLQTNIDNGIYMVSEEDDWDKVVFKTGCIYKSINLET